MHPQPVRSSSEDQHQGQSQESRHEMVAKNNSLYLLLLLHTTASLVWIFPCFRPHVTKSQPQPTLMAHPRVGQSIASCVTLVLFRVMSIMVHCSRRVM